MLSLAELQGAFHSAVLGEIFSDIHITGTLSLTEALSVHRNTAIGGLVQALRLSHPTVDALVGEVYFDKVAMDYVLSHPPRQAALDGYGVTFARFLEKYPSAQSLPYLGDVARLDWTIEHVVRRAASTRAFALDNRVSIQLPISLTVLKLEYPAHSIRASLGDDEALAAINLQASAHYVVAWRSGDAAAVRAIRAPGAKFLIALLDGFPVESAIQIAGGDAAETLSVIQNDIFAAPFCAVTPLEESRV